MTEASRAAADLAIKAAAAKQLLEAKIMEHTARLMTGGAKPAETARVEAISALEAHLDLNARLMRQVLRDGFGEG